eukprot:COSAG01_NODE_81_length_27820_cov_22.659753_21_plen_99_part_00
MSSRIRLTPAGLLTLAPKGELRALHQHHGDVCTHPAACAPRYTPDPNSNIGASPFRCHWRYVMCVASARARTGAPHLAVGKSLPREMRTVARGHSECI